MTNPRVTKSPFSEGPKWLVFGVGGGRIVIFAHEVEVSDCGGLTRFIFYWMLGIHRGFLGYLTLLDLGFLSNKSMWLFSWYGVLVSW